MNYTARQKTITYRKNKSGCHLVTSHCFKGNYPKMMMDGKSVPIHRIVFQMNYGKITNGLIVRHKCDKPRCINPEHLELGTHADNARDKMQRGRIDDRHGERNSSCKLNEASVVKIFTSSVRREDLALRYRVSLSAINAIKSGANWSYLTQKYKRVLRRRMPNERYTVRKYVSIRK